VGKEGSLLYRGLLCSKHTVYIHVNRGQIKKLLSLD
jgi:hypothetical protein